MDSLGNGLIFLIRTIFELYLMLLVLTTLLRMTGADFYNPVVQFLVKVTDPVLKPARKLWRTKSRFDITAWVVIILIKIIEVILISLIVGGLPNIISIILFSVLSLVRLVINVYFYAIIVQAVLSFVAQQNNPLVPLLYHLTEPLLKPVRRLIPPIGGIDISPIPVLILLQLINIVVLNPFL